MASAGHPPALVVRTTGEVEECHEPGTLVGITAASYSDRRRDDLALLVIRVAPR